MGSNDAGLTVLNKCPALDRRTAEAARALGLRAHVVGGWQVWIPYTDSEAGQKKWRRKNVKRQVLHAAADVEGHEGTDSRYGSSIHRWWVDGSRRCVMCLVGDCRYMVCV